MIYNVAPFVFTNLFADDVIKSLVDCQAPAVPSKPLPPPSAKLNSAPTLVPVSHVPLVAPDIVTVLYSHVLADDIVYSNI